MSAPTEAKGLSFVLMEAGPNVSEEEHHDWYDNEHSPARLTIPSFHNAVRFKAVDGLKPTYLTLYDISDATVADGPEYQAVRANGSERDKRLLETIQFLNRRSYSTIFTQSHPTAASNLPGKFVLYVAFDVKPEGEDDFNRWYEEEHIPMIAETPGWVRSRRFVLHNNMVRGIVDPKVIVCKYAAIHDFTTGDYMDAPQLKAASSTSWRAEVMKGVVNKELRRFELFKEYRRAE